MGSSKHWSYALESLTGLTTVNAQAMIEYLEPLLKWLQVENSKYSDETTGF
jgi:hypothetical protein